MLLVLMGTILAETVSQEEQDSRISLCSVRQAAKVAEGLTMEARVVMYLALMGRLFLMLAVFQASLAASQPAVTVTIRFRLVGSRVVGLVEAEGPGVQHRLGPVATEAFLGAAAEAVVAAIREVFQVPVETVATEWSS